MIRDRLFAIFDRWRALRDVAQMTDRELEDLGMTRGQMADLMRMPADSAERMLKMAAVFGLTEDEVKAHHDEYMELLGTCGTCGARGPCARTLANPGADAAEQASHFCPNAGVYTVKAETKRRANSA